jgi:DUF971 family protein
MATAHNPQLTDIRYHQKSKVLELAFDNGEHFNLTAEYLRVYSPSAEVRGHSPAQAVLQVGKGDVEIEQIQPVGNYAVILRFDDNHDTGIYDWNWLYYLGKNYNTLWPDYLDKLQKAGAKRRPDS